MYLHGHIDVLVEKIRNNAIVQYCKPFISISLNEMSIAFNTSVQQIEKDLLTLIINGHIKARIDSHNKVLLPSPFYYLLNCPPSPLIYLFNFFLYSFDLLIYSFTFY